MAKAQFSVRTAVATVGLVVFAALFGSLGAWQLRRAEENRALAEQFASRGNAAPLPGLPSEMTDANRFHRVAVEGAYDAAPQFLLDNMLHDGAAGYHVLTVLRMDSVAQRLIVNRGWVPSGLDRGVLPAVPVATEARRVVGRIERLPQPALRLTPARANTPKNDAVATVEYPTMSELATRLGRPLFDYQLLLDPEEADGYVRDWRAPGVNPERNLVYAGQWLLLAVGALGAAVTIPVRAARRRP